MLNTLKKMFVTLALAAAVLLPAINVSAATVHMKDGRVLEGRITKEGDGFVFLMVKIAGLEKQEILTTDQIKKIDRDPAPAKPDEPVASIPSPASGGSAEKPAVISAGATRVAFISLEEMVGPFLNADALLHSAKLLDELPENERPEIIVLRINSGGGALSEVQGLSDAIHKTLKRKYRVVAWIESAISAASLTAFNCEEIYMMKEGNIGGTVAFFQAGGGNQAVKDEELEQILQAGEEISKRGGYNPLIMRAMQVFMDLSADIDADGNITWREDLGGEFKVNTKDRILTFDSIQALKFNISRGTADTKDELAKAMGCTEWVEVGPKADQYQIEFREAVQTAQVRSQELQTKMNIALQANDVGKARTYLNELRSIVRRAPSMEFYGGLDKQYFEETERQLRKIVEALEKAKRDAQSR